MFGILVCGDSISFGRGESPSIGWAGRLKKKFESKDSYNCLFNLGIPGDTSKTLLKRFDNELKARIKYIRPEDKFIVMIAIGTNDSRCLGDSKKAETKLVKFEKNVSKLIEIARRYTKHVVVVGLTPVDEALTNPYESTTFTNERIKEFDSVLKVSAKMAKVDYIYLFDKIFEMKYERLLADGLHPNKKGYEKMFKIIKSYLEKKKLI